MMFVTRTMLGSRRRSGIFIMVRRCLSPIFVLTYVNADLRTTHLCSALRLLGHGVVEGCDV